MNYSQPPSKMIPVETKKARRFSPRLVLAGLAVLALAGAIAYRIDAGSTGAGGGGRGGGRGGQTVPVRVAAAETRDIPILAHTIGTVLPNATVSVKSQIDGELVSAAFKEGDLVKEGQVLFRIDPRPMAAALRQAEAQMARDQAQLASAQRDADRAAMLAERGIVSTQQRDQTIAQAKALTATQAADQAAVDRARLNFSYTTIKAPVSGKTGSFLVHPGNLVRANNDVLVVINQVQPVKVSFFLPQNELPQLQDRVREGNLVATLQVHSENRAPVTASESDLAVKVDFIGNVVDEKTGTIELRATSQNPDLRLVPGELLDVTVQLDTMRNATVVPREAVNIGQTGGTYLFIVGPDRKAEMRPVKVRYQDDRIAAVDAAVKPGEQVVTDGQLRVTPGAEVSIAGAPEAQPAGVVGPRPQGGRGRGGGGGGRRG